MITSFVISLAMIPIFIIYFICIGIKNLYEWLDYEFDNFGTKLTVSIVTICLVCLIYTGIVHSNTGNSNSVSDSNYNDPNYVSDAEEQKALDDYTGADNGTSDPNYDDYEYISGDSNSDSGDTHWVDSYERSDGTQVDGYERSNPDGNPYNNLNPD